MAPTAAPITSSAQALQALNQYQSGMKDPNQVINDAQTAAGIPQAQQQVTGLQGAIQNTQNLLKQVAPSIMGRTANSLVTSAQADKQITNEQTPLNDQLNTENTDYGNQETALEQARSDADTKAQAEITGNQGQLAALQDLYKTLSGNEQAQAALAEQQREAAATRAATTSSGASPSFGGATLGGGPAGTIAKNSAGGYAITNAAGKGETMAQYLAANGYSSASSIASAAAQLLSQSGTTSDHNIANVINSGKYTPAQLAQMYPQVFGGSF